MNFREWIDKGYVRWSVDQPRGERSQEGFARWLGITRGALLNYLNKGTMPEGENLKAIARKLGPEVYDIVGLPRPDPDLDVIDEYWPSLPDSLKKAIARQVHEHIRNHPR